MSTENRNQCAICEMPMLSDDDFCHGCQADEAVNIAANAPWIAYLVEAEHKRRNTERVEDKHIDTSVDLTEERSMTRQMLEAVSVEMEMSSGDFEDFSDKFEVLIVAMDELNKQGVYGFRLPGPDSANEWIALSIYMLSEYLAQYHPTKVEASDTYRLRVYNFALHGRTRGNSPGAYRHALKQAKAKIRDYRAGHIVKYQYHS